MNRLRTGKARPGRIRAVGVPCMVRVRVRDRRLARALARLGAIALWTTALTALAFAQPHDTAPSRAEPQVLRAPTVPPVAPTPDIPAPADLRDPAEWMAYRQARHIAALPAEARLFYRQGLIAREAGDMEKAITHVRAAADLDPSYVQPRLTLASWLLTRDPSQSLMHYASVLEHARHDFTFQLDFVANAFLVVIEAVFVGLLAAMLLVLWVRRDELTHPLQESLSRWLSVPSARGWSYGLLVLPFICGFGIALPAAGMLAALWTDLRIRERAVLVMLVAMVAAAPLSRSFVDRMALPMHATRGPFYGVPTIENESYDAARFARLRERASVEPSNGFVQFGLAWTARQGNDLATAEAAYRRVAALWPSNDRVLNNLGNILAMQGRVPEAIAVYDRATKLNPENVAAWYNASQLHTQRFEYEAASAALARASAIHFEFVKSYQSRATDDGLMPLADQWLEPDTFWRALLRAPIGRAGAGSLPLVLRNRLEASGGFFSALLVLVVIGSAALGISQRDRLPLRACSNCGRVTCRRCAERRRELALCPGCALIEAKAETAEFSRLLLVQHRDRLRRRTRLWRTALATIIPGYGLISHRRIIFAVLYLSATWCIGRVWFGYGSAFSVQPRLSLHADDIPLAFLATLMLVVWGLSLLGYFHRVGQERAHEAQLAAAQRGRITQATRRVSALAA